MTVLLRDVGSSRSQNCWSGYMGLRSFRYSQPLTIRYSIHRR